LKSLFTPATTATEIVATEGKADKKGNKKPGRPAIILTRSFREEWYHIISPEVFIHADYPNRIIDASEFNSMVRPFSSVDDTARLVRGDQANKLFKMHYLPGAPSGMYGNALHGQFLNTYCPPDVKPIDGDPKPFLDYMEKLIPGEEDREQVLRWCATLIARPEIKMLYGVLMISEAQGVGKTTLGEKILAPLVGLENVSAPSETDIVESQFNGWIAHKRLAVVNEIYAGTSTKAYNKLKSIITDRTITVNKKHMPTYEIENWLHVFACSNSMRALKLSFDDRRWLVPKITEMKQTLDYWNDLNEWLESGGGLGIILNWAKQYLLDHRPVMPGETAPSTEAKKDMVRETLSPGLTLALNTMETWLEDNDKKPIYFTDISMVEHIRSQLYEGRQSDRLEKPGTIRRLAKDSGWFIGNHRTKVFSADGSRGRIISNRREVVELEPEELEARFGKPLSFPMVNSHEKM
jgi:hypothetical protein